MKTWLIVGMSLCAAAGCSLNGPGASDDDGSGSGGASVSSGVGADNTHGAGAGMTGGPGSGGGSSATGIDVLGNLAHSLDAVQLDAVGTSADGLSGPSDVAIHPTTGEVWVSNRSADAMTIFANLGDAAMSSVTHHDNDSGQHFLANPSGLAFGDNGLMATIHEEDQPTQGSSTPADFMGPTLWPSSSGLFDGGHYSHMDMLHNTPNGMGIAWDSGNAYWVFDGYHRSITLYDFHRDHGPGGTDHSDGEIVRYVEGQVARVPGVPSNLVKHGSDLYIADTGNNRIAIMDTLSGSPGSIIGPNYDGADMYEMTGATLTTVIDGAQHGLQRPSGLAISDGILFVSDNATSTIYGFDLAGNLLDWLPTDLPPGCLMGLAVDGEGRLVIVDAPNNRLLRISAR